MAQSGFTPLSLYYSATPSSVPVAANLAPGELALNTADGKLYFKNSSGVVTLLASTGVSTPVTTFSAGTTGFTPSSATNGAITLAGTLNIANGGTGQTTASAAFNALSPITTAGDLIIGSGVNTATRLGIGTNGYVLTSNGTTASWQPTTASGVSSFSAGTTGLTPSTATTGAVTLAGTLAVANGGTGVTTSTGSGSVVLSTSPVLVTPILGTPTSAILTNATNLPLTTGVSGILPIANGGTNISTYTTGDILYASATNTLGKLAAGTNGYVLTLVSGLPSWQPTGAGANVTSISFGTTGLTPNTATSGIVSVGGTLNIANGGTGQTTASGAFNALSPITTAGDLIIGNGTNSATRLGIGTNGYVLTSNGITASWASVPSSMVYPGAGIPNSTGSSWGTSYTTTGSGSVVALSTSPSFTTPSLGAATATSVTIGTLGYTAANALFTAQNSVNNYAQIVLQNSNTGTTASADFIVNNSNSTDTTFYGDFGMNSSGFSGSGAFNQPNNVYLTSTSSDLAIGTTTSHAIRFVVNNGATDAATISAAGALTLGTALGVASGGTGATSLTGVLIGNGTSAFTTTTAPSGLIVGTTDTQTLTNKRINPRVVTIADGTSVTINGDITDQANQTNTQVAGTLTINAPTGTPVDGQKLVFRLQSTNAQTFSWNAIFTGGTTTALPTTSSGSSKYDYMGFFYNATASKWQLVGTSFGY